MSNLKPRGRVKAIARTEWGIPAKGIVARYIFTCAQSNTKLFEPAWLNLLALAHHYKARICVSTFTYDTGSYGASSVKRGKASQTSRGEPWYAPEIEEYVLDRSVQVAPGLTWCGEMNILPTAVRPLSGLEAYTGRSSAIIPHVKFALESIASHKSEGTKFNYTTGTVTQRNYIAKKEGQKASFHHGYGALLVEVDSDGEWFCRQLNADSDGTIYDLDLCAKAGRVTKGHRLEAITWGDIHVGTVLPYVEKMYWGEGGMLDVLEPKYQFMHDVLDFRSRSHHDRFDWQKRFKRFVEGREDVQKEVLKCAAFLEKTSFRDWCNTIVVSSNHDRAMEQWLREGDYRADPVNALFFLKAQARWYEALASRDTKFDVASWAMKSVITHPRCEEVRFLHRDESFILCPEANRGIECGMHGDDGPNGARANLRAFARTGRKSNTGHSHVAGICDGAYSAGITGDFEQEYNHGMSSWSRSAIGTYANGKRAILTSYAGKWRA